MIEKHPFGPFVPKNATRLLLGSFTTKEANDKNFDYQWFYANRRNQFWPIMEKVYGRDLKKRSDMEKLFSDLHMALGDIIYQCERRKNSNLDVNLFNIIYAVEDIANILHTNHIEVIYFSSRGVEIKFRQVFKALIAKYPDITLITLPSSSPRFTMKLADKIAKYKQLLPHNFST